MCGPRNEAGTVKRQVPRVTRLRELRRQSLILRRSLQNVHGEEFQDNREFLERKTTSSIHSVESSVAIRTEKIAECSYRRLISISSCMGKSLKGCRQGSRVVLLDKGPRSMEISTVYACQDTEFECETEIEQWLIEDFHRQRCEVKARRDAKLCSQILTALGRREWKTWNDVPLELRQDTERIHRNLGHASADLLEKLFRDANVSDDAISALKRFRCDACDRLKQTPSKRKVAVNHAETFNDIVHGCEDHFQGVSSCEEDTEGAEHRGCCIRYAHRDPDC